MILVIDNYDSFTFNLVQYLGEMGQELKVFRNDAITLDEIESLAPESIVISPGPGRPENSGIIIHADPGIFRENTDPGRVPGPSGDRRRFWRRRCFGAANHARKNQRDLP